MPSTDTRDETIIAQARQLVVDSQEAAAAMGRFDLDPVAGRRPTAALILLAEMVRIVDALRAPVERGEGERDGRLREAVWEFVRDFGRNGTKTGRADYVATVSLDRIEYLRRALGSDFASPPAPVEVADALGGMVEPDAADRAAVMRIVQQHCRPAPVEGEREPLRAALEKIERWCRTHEELDRSESRATVEGQRDWAFKVIAAMGQRARAALASPPAPVEGTRERLVEEVTQVAFSAYTMGAAANEPDDVVVSLRRVARECADRILAALPVQGEREEGLFPLVGDTNGGEDDEEGVRCTCEWQSEMDGRVHARWPFVLDPYCKVHGRREAEAEAWPEGAPDEFGERQKWTCPRCGVALIYQPERHCPSCALYLLASPAPSAEVPRE